MGGVWGLRGAEPRAVALEENTETSGAVRGDSRPVSHNGLVWQPVQDQAEGGGVRLLVLEL
jgi:hypothetical protein